MLYDSFIEKKSIPKKSKYQIGESLQKIETIKTFNIHTQKTQLILNKFILSCYSEININDHVIKNYKNKSKQTFDDEYQEDEFTSESEEENEYYY